MGNVSFKVLNLILSNLDDKPSSIKPVEGYEDIYTVNFENGEVAQVEVFPENEGINFHWVKVNDNHELLDKAYDEPKGSGEVIEFKGTKGKWIVGKSYNRGNLQNSMVVTSIHDLTVAYLGFLSKKEDTSTDLLRLANALLISKAPEMLEMLKESFDTFTCNDSSDRDLKSRIEQLIKSATQI